MAMAPKTTAATPRRFALLLTAELPVGEGVPELLVEVLVPELDSGTVVLETV